MILQTTLCLAAAAAIINIWLMIRIGRVRAAEKIFLGDGGNETVIRRMRAQANLVECAPFVLLLVAAIELSGKGGMWLPIVGAVFLLGRICHAFGMDVTKSASPLRAIGALTAMLTLLGLAVVAVLIAVGKM